MWYKLAQLTITDDTVGHGYLNIGHPESNHESAQKMLWFWHDGKIITKDVTGTKIGENEETHSSWGEFNMADPLYQGRFDSSSEGKLISLVGPYEKRNLDLPGPLLKELIRTFGDDIKIYRY